MQNLGTQASGILSMASAFRSEAKKRKVEDDEIKVSANYLMKTSRFTGIEKCTKRRATRHRGECLLHSPADAIKRNVPSDDKEI